MIIEVTVKFEKRKEKIVKKTEKEYLIYLRSEPVRGEANKEVTTEIARFFNVKEESIKIVEGKKERKKKILIKNL